VDAAWQALQACSSAAELVKGSGHQVALLRQYRAAIKDEVARAARTAPRFSDDGRMALLRVTSGGQHCWGLLPPHPLPVL
jgi:hypothetical protein